MYDVIGTTADDVDCGH